MTLAEGRPRVMHVITGLDSGGAETQLAQLLIAMRAKGADHRVVSLKAGGAIRAHLLDAGVAVRDLGMRRYWPRFGGLLRLWDYIGCEKPRVVQSWLYHADLAALAALRCSGRRRATKLVWNIRCSDLDLAHYSWGLRLAVRIGALLSHQPDAIVINSTAGRIAHEALGYRPRRFALIENGIDSERFRPNPEMRARLRSSLGLAPETPVIVHVARIDPMKDHKTLYAALDLLPGVQALLIGSGTQKLPPHKSVLALGRRDDVADLLSVGDLIVLPSAFGEGFSNALAEGMACGLPPVASDVGDARRIVGDCGVIVPPREPSALAEAIQKLLDEPAEARAARGAAARQRIVDEFSMARMISAYESLYASL